MYLPGDRFRLLPQRHVEDDIKPVPGLAVKERSLWDRCPEHLLQADRLGAELHLVAIVRLGLSPLVLHREREPCPVYLAVELNNIGNAQNPQSQGTDEDGSTYAHIAPRFLPKLMDAFVKNSSFRGKAVFIPDLFGKHQSTLSGTKGHVLQRRKRQKVVFVIHVLRLYNLDTRHRILVEIPDDAGFPALIHHCETGFDTFRHLAFMKCDVVIMETPCCFNAFFLLYANKIE